uniref:Uncharacterized protein n=1 Tax=Rhizophora mucronata TaxID=61149 RepID=A0A2P2NFI7_RHIMU
MTKLPFGSFTPFKD